MAESQNDHSPSRESSGGAREITERKVFYFRQVAGKVLESLEISSSAEGDCIVLNLNDNTSLTFAVNTSVSLSADYSEWNGGEQRVLDAWRPIRHS